MPTLRVDVDLADIVESCSQDQLRELIEKAKVALKEAPESGENPKPEKPHDIAVDVGRRELRDLIDRNFHRLSRHAMYVARDLGV